MLTAAFALLCCLAPLAPAAASAPERAGQTTPLPTEGQDTVFRGPSARYVVTVEAAGARCAVPADFDGDGDLDIVSVSSNDNTVAWYERLADGSYGPKQMISRASNGARIVTVGDIDQDNRTDVIVASYYDHTVGWFRNLGGRFGSMNMISRTAISAQGVSVADLDNDGDLDVLSASSGDNTVAWYENLGGGQFCEVKNIVDSNSVGVRTVVAADLDEDGFLDLAVASKDDNSITWYKNDQQNNFQKIVIDGAARGAYSLVVKDVDQDGHLDLVTAANMDGYIDANGEGGKVSFYRNGLFSSSGSLCNFTKIQVTAGNTTGQNDFDWFVLSVWAGDLDGDGDVDIASASFSLLHQGGISWYENVDGTGNAWTRHQIYKTPGAKTGHYVFGADMDGDGDNDLLAVTNGDNKVQILTAKTRCDNSSIAPREECCPSEKYWNGSACLSCPQGTFLRRQNGATSCERCSTACPRPGLFFSPTACHGLKGCGDEAQSFKRCDCGVNRYLEKTTGVCAACPDGMITLGDRQRRPADFLMAKRSFLDQTSYYISDMSWQGFNSSRCQVPTCAAGKYFNMTALSCLPCPAGSFSNGGGGVTRCTACPAGSACAEGAAVPLPCQAGNYSGAGAHVCLVSPAGSVTPRAGMAAPELCKPGTVAADAGMVSCSRCPVGSVAEGSGQSTCTPCGHGHSRPGLWTSMKAVMRNDRLVWAYTDAGSMLTANSSIVGVGACTCDVGARASDSGECVPCEVGLDCPGGPEEPSVLRGYYANTRENLPAEAFVGVSGDYSVFRCMQDVWCPGGLIGSCGEGRSGLGCAECEGGLIAGSGGKCRECSGGDFAIFVCFCVLFVMALFAMAYIVDSGSGTTHGLSAILILVVSSLIMALMQKIGVFHSLSIAWVSPIAEIIELLSVLNLSLDLLRFECLGKVSVLSRYIASLCPIFLMLGAGCLVHVVLVLVRHGGRFRERTPALIQTVGTVIMFFLIAIVHVVVSPFHCVGNPNGLFTMYAYPEVICGESSVHGAMIGIAMAACILPVGFAVIVCLVVWEFPKRIARGDSKFLRSFYFLIFRFRPEAFWYLLVFTTRSIVLPLVPLLPNRVGQILLMVTLVSGVAWIQCRSFPWRIQLANYLDSAMMLCLIIFLCAVGFLSEGQDLTEAGSASREDGNRMIAMLCSVLLVTCLTLGAGVLLFAVFVHLRGRTTKEFKYFICHHKKDAAAQARLLKINLQSIVSCNVFIDSDNLENLDILLDTVRNKVETLVVYLTKDTLTRCWCAGEITTAVECGIPILKVVCPCWTAPTTTQLDNLGSFLDLSDTNLIQMGITFDMVRAAYTKFLNDNIRCHNLPLELGGTARFVSVTEGILSKNFNANSTPAPIEPNMVVISTGSFDDNEALASSVILARKIQKSLLQVCPAGLCLLADHTHEDILAAEQNVHDAAALVVVLSVSSLTCVAQLEDIVNGMIYTDCIIPVILPSFVFPTRNYYSQILPMVWPGDVDSAKQALEDFFHRIGIPLSINASDEILDAQANSVVERISSKVNKRPSRSNGVRPGSTVGRLRSTNSVDIPPGMGRMPSINAGSSSGPSGRTPNHISEGGMDSRPSMVGHNTSEPKIQVLGPGVISRETL